MAGIVVIGAGQAGSSLVAKLRALGHEGALTLIGDEAAPPYQRPPLSKKYLLGEMEVERLFLRPATFLCRKGHHPAHRHAGDAHRPPAAGRSGWAMRRWPMTSLR